MRYMNSVRIKPSTAPTPTPTTLLFSFVSYTSFTTRYHHSSTPRSDSTNQEEVTTKHRSSSALDPAIPDHALPLGHPLPLDEHACSVSLPTWKSVVGYEEGWPDVTSKLVCGYPRFVYHPYVRQLMNRALDIDHAKRMAPSPTSSSPSSPSLFQDRRLQDTKETTLHDKNWDCIVLPSYDSALRCHDFLVKACGYHDGQMASPRFTQQMSNSTHSRTMIDKEYVSHSIPLFCKDNALDFDLELNLDFSEQQDNMSNENDPFYNPVAPIRVVQLHAAGTFAVVFPAQTAFAIEAKSYWQHTGEIVTSRRAECALLELFHKDKEEEEEGGGEGENGVKEKTNADKTHSCQLDQEKIPFHRFTSSFYPSHVKNGTKDATLEKIDPTNNTCSWKLCTWTNTKYMSLHPSMVDSNHDRNTSAYLCSTTSFVPTSSSSSSSIFHENVRHHIANITSTSSSFVFLTTSGMASIYTALRSARRRALLSRPIQQQGQGQNKNEVVKDDINDSNGGTAIVYGFPYLDTLKMCSRPEFVPGGVEFFGHGNQTDFNDLKEWLQRRSELISASSNTTSKDAGVSILLTEYPSNPLLKCPDLHALRELADRYNFALVVDDTIGNFANLDLLSTGLADAVCTSLTKLYNGRGDVIAGSVVTNPNTKIGQWMQQDLLHSQTRRNQWNNYESSLLFAGDAAALQSNSKDFLERSHKINKTAEALAGWLKEREDVAKVYYPKFTCVGDTYEKVRNHRPIPMPSRDTEVKFHQAGYGGLMSIILQPNICQRTFYDSLDVSKGPSLGTNFTLVCPYTLLAHYHELDFAVSYDVEPNLLRISVGLEEFDFLKEKFSQAFQQSRLYPKVPPLGTNTIVKKVPNGIKDSTGIRNFGSLTSLASRYTRGPTLCRRQRNMSPSTRRCFQSMRHVGPINIVHDTIRKSLSLVCKRKFI